MRALARCFVPAAIAAAGLALVAPVAAGCTTCGGNPANPQSTASEVTAVPAVRHQAPAARPEGKLNTALIEQLTGLKGKLNDKENVFRVTHPRNDLNVTAAGVTITPPFGTTAWAAFTPAMGGVMVMGDLVLTEDQVNLVMSEALNNGLEVTALSDQYALGPTRFVEYPGR